MPVIHEANSKHPSQRTAFDAMQIDVGTGQASMYVLTSATITGNPIKWQNIVTAAALLALFTHPGLIDARC